MPHLRRQHGPRRQSVSPVTRFSDPEESVELDADSYYDLVLGMLTRNLFKGLEFADRILSSIGHINDQTVNDEVVVGRLAACAILARARAPEYLPPTSSLHRDPEGDLAEHRFRMPLLCTP
jgi:hypothetical protein